MAVADSSYVIDRLMAMILGRPPGISDDDIDVELPNSNETPLDVSLPSMRSGTVLSSIHFVKLQRIESQIQRTIYAVANRHRGIDFDNAVALLNSIDQWEKDIPLETTSSVEAGVPCCSSDWFQLRAVEARLHILRPVCTSQRGQLDKFLSLLAVNAANGCESQ